MGFGLLLIGYVFYLNTVIPVYTIPLSALVMAFGLRKLKVWNSGLRGAWRTDLATLVYGLAAAGLAGAIAAGVKIPETLSSIVSAGLCLLVLLFHFYLGSGVIQLTQEVGLLRLRGRTLFFRTSACIYWLLYAFFNLDLGKKLEPVVARLFIPMAVVGLVVAIIGISVIFSCYTDIGLPDEQYVPEKPGLIDEWKRKNEEVDRKDD